MALLFNQTKQNISLHINNCYKERELSQTATVKKSLTVQKEGKRTVKREIEYYNLDVIISVGYRVKSAQGTKFRQWATQRLKDYLVKGYAINKKRLEQKRQEVQYLKDGIHILSKAIEEKAGSPFLPAGIGRKGKRKLKLSVQFEWGELKERLMNKMDYFNS